MAHSRTIFAYTIVLALVFVLLPSAAFAATDSLPFAVPETADAVFSTGDSQDADNAQDESESNGETEEASLSSAVAGFVKDAKAEEAAKTDKVLDYDPAAIAAIGTQESTGHTICCPSFACAYADAVIDGTINDHSYYTCSCCTWTDWGGGGSFCRNVGTDEQLLREAYDQIASGKPTVVHVLWSGGEHWIALIGYGGVTDPDHLTLGNFIALDPWDGAQINAASKYALYGDGCEHISDR